MYVKSSTTQAVLLKRRFLKPFAFLLVITGVLLIFNVVTPILQWQIFYAPSLSSTILSPIPKTIMLNASSLASVLAEKTTRGASFDSTQASNWFPIGNPTTNVHKEYHLAIPTLGIDDAIVSIGSDDLSKSLVHYGGSSLPGEYGNAVIFGHSVLPQFFNAKNYKTIFSTLHTLKVGDKINITYDNVSYQYSIFNFRVVDPTEISVLEQQYDNDYLTLITCTPPGTYWKRLVVKAKIDNIVQGKKS